jgi:hypothetical protein
MEEIEVHLKKNMRFNWKNPKPGNLLIVGLIIIGIIVFKKIL